MADDRKPISNVLCLDGGGVRGLSTLLILRKLLCLINVELHPKNPRSGEKPLLPSQVFDLVVGTSTGGLIALMIVKLGMNVDQCITTYKSLSKEIFSHRHKTSLFGFGHVKKYCGKHLSKVLIDQVIKPHLDSRSHHPENLNMDERDNHKDLDCTVICRELEPTNMSPLHDAVCLCSHGQRTTKTACLTHVKVAVAARATSAAPTYFSHVEIMEKLLVDGGFGHTNNPSFAAYEHYFTLDIKNYTKVQFVNIGTGREPENFKPQRSIVEHIPNAWLRDVIHTITGLKGIAVDVKQPIATMQALVNSSYTLSFDSFSADKGDIHRINLAEYKKLQQIEDLTNQYLEDEIVLSELRRVARELADTYRIRNATGAESIRSIMQQQSQVTSTPLHDNHERHPSGLTHSSSATSMSEQSHTMMPNGATKAFDSPFLVSATLSIPA